MKINGQNRKIVVIISKKTNLTRREDLIDVEARWENITFLFSFFFFYTERRERKTKERKKMKEQISVTRIKSIFPSRSIVHRHRSIIIVIIHRSFHTHPITIENNQMYFRFYSPLNITGSSSSSSSLSI